MKLFKSGCFLVFIRKSSLQCLTHENDLIRLGFSCSTSPGIFFSMNWNLQSTPESSGWGLLRSLILWVGATSFHLIRLILSDITRFSHRERATELGAFQWGKICSSVGGRLIHVARIQNKTIARSKKTMQITSHLCTDVSLYWPVSDAFVCRISGFRVLSLKDTQIHTNTVMQQFQWLYGKSHLTLFRWFI